MKKFFFILFIAYACNVNANSYGNQDSVSLTVRGTYGGTQTLLGLVHVPADYNTDITTKHPFIVFICGAGYFGTTQVLVQNEGMSNALYSGTWDGTAINPKTGAKEEFITLSLQHPNSSSGIDGRQVDDAIGWLFTYYHGIDTTRGTVTGLSRGGGSTCGDLQHILTANPCTSWTYFHPVHNVPFFIPMSAENNSCDPVDSVFIYNNHVWGFGGDSTGCNDIHAVTTHDLCNNIDKIKPNLAQFTTYYSAAGGCHSGWDRFYAASYTSSYKSDVYSYASISIYQAALLYSSAGNTNPGAPVNSGNAISVKTISASSFCVTSITGSSVSVSYTATGSFTNGNVFQVQLSDASGNFTSGVNIGTVTTTNTSGTISCTIPNGTATGTGYRIRVNSTNPATTGSDNGTNLTVNLAANSIAPTTPQNIHTGINGTTLTVTEASVPTSRTWYYGTTAGGPYNTSTGITATTYTPNFSVANTYYVVCVSTTSCSTISSNYITINVTNPTPPPATISTNAISGSPFCVTATSNQSLSVSFTSVGTYTSGNNYTAQLSDINGSFASPINVGTLVSNANSGTISCTIPNGTATGTGYRIRVNSSNPQITGSDNGTNLTIKLAGNSIAPATPQNIHTGVNGTVLTVTEKSAPTSRTWYYGTSQSNYYSTGVTATTYTPNFSTTGRFYVVCQSVWSCATIQSNYVRINVTRARTKTNGLQSDEASVLSVQSQTEQKSDFSVRSQSDEVICNYTLQDNAAVQLIIYDEYQRPRASFSATQNAGKYMHTFIQHLPNGLYVVVLQTSKQKIASQKIVISN